MDALEATVRGIGGLLAVLALVWILSRLARKRLGAPTGSSLRVRQRVGLGRRSGVAVIEAGSRTLLVGIGEAQVTFLADLEPWDAPARPAAARPAVPAQVRVVKEGPAEGDNGLRDLIGRIQERTVRR